MIDRTSAQLKLRDMIFLNPPYFHYWKGEPQTGGFSKPFFEFFEKILFDEVGDASANSYKLLETGAGLSSLFFLLLGYKVTSFSLPDVIEKMELFFKQDEISIYRESWTPYAGRSELLLPKHALETDPDYNVCLIDGSHSVHSVFVDFMYAHELLKVGGVIFVDDTHFPGPNLLSQLLNQLDSYEACGAFQKVKVYKKINGRRSYDNMLEFKFQHPEV